MIGTPEQVADRLIEVNEEFQGDGFLINSPFQKSAGATSTRSAKAWCRRCSAAALTRTEYTKSTLRETLREF